MNKSSGLLAATALALSLTACSAGATQAPADVSKPRTDHSQPGQPAQPIHRDPDCRHIPCPR